MMSQTPKRAHKPISNHKDSAFESFIQQSSNISKQLKSSILKRLNMAEKGIPVFEAKSIECSKNYPQAWEALNRQLRKILSLLKVLLCEQSSIESQWKNVSVRNQKRILNCCTAIRQTEYLNRESSQNTNKFGFISKFLNEMKNNLYSYESYSQQFQFKIQQLTLNDVNDIKTNSKKTQPLNYYGNQHSNQRSHNIKYRSTYQKPSTPLKSSGLHKKAFVKDEKLYTPNRQLDNYISELQAQVIQLRQEIDVIQKDRDQLKQYNMLLLQSKGVLNSQKRQSTTPQRKRSSFGQNSASMKQGQKIARFAKLQKSDRLERSKYTDRYLKNEMLQKLKGNTTPVGITNFCIKFNTQS